LSSKAFALNAETSNGLFSERIWNEADVERKRAGRIGSAVFMAWGEVERSSVVSE
jgi:hypothetical protein